MATNRKKITMDGNEAAAYVAYAFSEFSGIYPITPYYAMADLIDQWSNQNKKNIFKLFFIKLFELFYCFSKKGEYNLMVE